MKRKVVLGLLDSSQDVSRKQDRWGTWRPAISISQHHDFSVSRYELLHEQRDADLATEIVEDLLTASPETEVRAWELADGALSDFSVSLKTLGDFVTSYRFIVEAEDYFLHVSNLAVPSQLSLIFLASHGMAPAQLLQSRMPTSPTDILGSYELIDVRPGSTVDRIISENTVSSSIERSLRGGVDCRNPQFNGVIRRMAAVLGRRNLAMLITGKRGTGKSTLARRFYQAKRERSLIDGPLVEVDCTRMEPGQISAVLRQFTALGGSPLPPAARLTPAAGNSGLLLLRNIEQLPAEDQVAVEETLQFGALARDMPGLPCEFQLVATSRLPLNEMTQQFRLFGPLANRISAWEFALLALAERLEDLPVYFEDEVTQQFVEFSSNLRFRGAAKRKYLEFAVSGQSSWEFSLEDLHRSLSRLALESSEEGISVEMVKSEFDRLYEEWAGEVCEEPILRMLPDEHRYALDLFQKTQLMEVLRICMRSRSLSEAGRRLFASSRARKKSVNDADRLRKYLQRFGLDWKRITQGHR